MFTKVTIATMQLLRDNSIKMELFKAQHTSCQSVHYLEHLLARDFNIKLYDAIQSHRSSRTYRADLIAKDVLAPISSAGTRASSSSNMQLYSIIVTRDQKIKEELLPPHFNQHMLLEAPV